MGLLNLFGGKKQQPKKASNLPPVLNVLLHNSKGIEVPEGDHEGSVYIYDGRPLPLTKKGGTFRMTVLPGEVEMVSIYTGTEGFGGENSCIAYKGQLVGYLGRGSYYVGRLVEKYGSASIVVRRDGTDQGGWPLLTPLLPDDVWFKKKLGIVDRETAADDPHLIVVSIYSDKWQAGNIPDGNHVVTLHRLPVPKGSSAKPHIEVALDGVVCTEANARNSCYKDLDSFVGSAITSCTLSTKTYDDGKKSHRLIIRRRPPRE